MTTTNLSLPSPTTMNSGKGIFIRCRICKERSDGAHFGIDSCRACAAFFRRSMSLKKSYTCRRGGDNCDIRRKDIATCRKCRLKKCIEAGMALENIQSQKGSAASPCPSDLPSPNVPTSSTHDFEEKQTIPHPQSSVYITNIPSSYTFFTDDAAKNYLQFLASHHKQLCIDRRAVEYSLGLCFSAEDRKQAYYDFLPSKNSKCTQIFIAHASAVNTFVSSVFPEAEQLPEEEKVKVCKSFVFAVWNMEAHYRTIQKFPYHPDCRFLAITETTYIDNENIVDFLPASVDESKRISVANSLKVYHKPCPQFQDALRALALCDVEYMTLIGLCFWNPTLQLSPEGAKVAAHCRRKVFHSFQNYHLQRGTDNFAVRLGEIMSVFSFFLESLTCVGEVMELLNLFDCFGDEKNMIACFREGINL
ncbi:unnamed protein product [Auanema sp. JU1783]|nr:unnamed protein product [Auanema sp. JU1783]